MRLLKQCREDFESYREFVGQVREDYALHHRDWTAPGFRAVWLHRFGVWAYAMRFQPVAILLRALYRMLFVYVRNQYQIELPRTTRVGRRFVIGHQGGVVIHPEAQLGDDCLIRHNVGIGVETGDGLNHAPILGNHVEVGSGAVILGRVRIGDHVRIAPKAVVDTDVPANSLVVVAPPRVIRFRSAEGSDADSASTADVSPV